ncbi:MAG TPA: 1-acyl-sn-glycerol-3-phosphate acyltransferase [Anaerolineales bacterium]|nr:1-acyl-sn-glycerol-3-phosphate acyltransferase [Anaerolineales bacterium]
MDEHIALTDLLTENLVYEITKALALPPTPIIKKIIASLTGKAIRGFAELASELDCVVAKEGIPGGARWLLPRFVKGHSARGVENIPPTGPLVIASNHPASIDSVVISAHVPRRDYKIIIGEIPFFKNLPNINKNAVFAPDPTDSIGRMQVVREVIRHLKNNGAILIFPRGEIEPDPDFMPYPDAEFSHWSRSLEIFLKQVPQTQVLTTIASGVISKRAMRNPITRFRRTRPDRQRLAFMYQMIRQMIAGRELFGLTPRITFGDLISAENTRDRQHMLQAITQSAHNVLKTHMASTLSHVASDSLRQV